MSCAYVDPGSGGHLTLADVAREWVAAEIGEGNHPSAMACAREYRIRYTPELARLVAEETERQTSCETCRGGDEVYDRGRFVGCPDCAA